MPATAKDIIDKYAPRAKDAYKQAFAEGGPLLAEYGITTPLRLAHFMAQFLHETGGGTVFVESGNYTERNLAKMWDSGNWHKYFANRDACIAMAAQCRIDHGVALFSLVYGNRMGNGPPSTRDGWTYRGRGVLQTTGRKDYRTLGAKVGVPFEEHPELVVAPEHALKPALAEWGAKNLNAAADRDDIKAVTHGINGGEVGLPSRKTWLARIRAFAGA